MILAYLDRLASRAVIAIATYTETIEAVMADEPVATPTPAKKPKRRYRRQAPGSIHPDQCPWCLGFDARTAEQKAELRMWRQIHPSSQRVACKGWRRCRFRASSRPGRFSGSQDRNNGESVATVGELIVELCRFDHDKPVRACAHMDGTVFEFEVGSLFVSSGDNDVAIVGYGARRKC